MNRWKQWNPRPRRRKSFLMPDLNFRFAPIYIKVKEMIDSGIIGKPIALHYREFIPAASLAEQWPAGSWAWNVEKSGGYPDFTLSVWSIDLVRWMFKSEVADVKWMTSYPRLDEAGNPWVQHYGSDQTFERNRRILALQCFSGLIGKHVSS